MIWSRMINQDNDDDDDNDKYKYRPFPNSNDPNCYSGPSQYSGVCL